MIIPHVLRSQQFRPEFQRQFIELASLMRLVHQKDSGRGLFPRHQGMNLFCQPSTRTHTSFMLGERMLGMDSFEFPDPLKDSSLAKGESLADTVRTFESLVSDPKKLVIVVRHPNANAAEEMAAASSGCHIINAGCGKSDGQHPTQAQQDLLTIFEHGCQFGYWNVENIGSDSNDQKPYRVLMTGDLRNGRTVRSLCYVLSHCFHQVEIDLVSPPSLAMGSDILEHLTEKGIKCRQSTDPQEFMEWVRLADTLYCTRFQLEDMGAEDRDQFGDYQRQFQVNAVVADSMKTESIIMHPWPRNNELLPEVDKNPRAVYNNQQMTNGVVARMTLLHLLLGGNQKALEIAARS